MNNQDVINENNAEAGVEAENKNRDQEVREAELVSENKKLSDELASLNDKYLRLAAEYDNYKKRTLREKEEIYNLSKSDVLKKLLPVFDNFEIAEKYSDNDQFAEGVRMIIRQFYEVLESLEVKEIPALNEKFDPELHEAVFHEDVEGVEENTITEVLKKGYVCGDKVLRHAMVKVAN